MTSRCVVLLAALGLAACGGDGAQAPTGPGTPPPAAVGTTAGRVVGALDGKSRAGVSVIVATATGAPSDAAGQFSVQGTTGVHALRFEEGESQPRTTSLRIPGGPVEVSLIPRDFDLPSFDQMIRTGGRLRRWTRAPRLVIVRPRLRFVAPPGGDEYEATEAGIPDRELDELQAHLESAYGELTQGRLGPLTGIEFEDAAPGTRVKVRRTGVIVVARYEGLQAATGYWGYGGWGEDPSGAASGGYIQLDQGPDRGPNRESLRAHELGHALGYMHVVGRISVMNQSARILPGDWDRQAVRIAFQRPPGNTTPDNDPPSFSLGLASDRAPGRLSWSSPTP